jgi:ABC-type glucose/galactose transport system permease subunit
MFELPIEIVGLIALAVAFLVAQGVKGLLANFGVDLGGKAAALTAILVAAIVLFVEGFVGLFPPDTQQIVMTILQSLAMVLGVFGVHKTYKGISPGRPSA